MSPQSTYIFMLVVQLTIYHQGVLARQDYYIPRQETQQMMLDDLDNSQEMSYYNEMRKNIPNDPNFLTNWPYLRELLPPNYDTSTNRILNFEDRISPIDEMLPNPLPLQKNIPNSRNSIKEQAQKKNSNSQKQYMHACHFKICNMGRKRNARYELY